jgi:hypothetical protein
MLRFEGWLLGIVLGKSFLPKQKRGYETSVTH